MLPPEIIRKIVIHTIKGPRAYRQIIHLSHVSKLWRDAVLGISALFTEARWGRWPLTLVETWCSRAGSRLLKIRVDDALLDSMCGTYGGPYQELLRKCAVQVGNLEFSHNAKYRDASDLFNLRMPSLQRLTTTQPRCIRSENMPMLRVLILKVASPEIPAPLTNVTHLHYSNHIYALQRDMVHMFSKLPQLQHLSLELIVGYDIQASTGPRDVLQSLISLEIKWRRLDDSPSLPSLSPLDLSSLPNLQTIVLHEGYGDIELESPSLFQSLALQVPHLKAFYFVAHSQRGEWLRLLPVLTPTESTTAIFPGLQDVVFSYAGGGRLKCTNKRYKLLRDFVLARKGVLTRLSIPPVKNMDVLQPIKDHIAHFEDSEWVPSPIFFN